MSDPRRSIECPDCGKRAEWLGRIWRCPAGHDTAPATSGSKVRRASSPPGMPRRSIKCPDCGKRAEWLGRIWRCPAGHEWAPEG